MDVTVNTGDCPVCDDETPSESFCAESDRSLKPEKKTITCSNGSFSGKLNYLVTRERCDTTGGVNVNSRGFEPGNVEKLRLKLKGVASAFLPGGLTSSDSYNVKVTPLLSTEEKCSCSGMAIEQRFKLVAKLQQTVSIADALGISVSDLTCSKGLNEKGKCCEEN